MGCCFSSNKASKKIPNKKYPHFPEKPSNPESDTSGVQENNRISPPLEEETVKEVLSETPNPKPSFLKIEEEKKIEKKLPIINPSVVEDLSEVSEICSFSESFSTSTVTERREDDERSREDGEVMQRVVRPPYKIPRKPSISGDFVGKSIVRRSDTEPSPRRKNNNAVKSVRGREVGQTASRRFTGNNRPRRDSGESSVGRSRSPAIRSNAGTNRPDVCPSSSSRRLGERSPGRVPVVSPENSRKLERKEENLPVSESLEEPLVSLECFIFL